MLLFFQQRSQLMEAPYTHSLAHDITRVGHALVNFQTLPNEAKGSMQIIHYLQHDNASLAITSYDRWEQVCLDIFKMPKEKIPQIDFSQRDVHVIHWKMGTTDRFPCLLRVDNLEGLIFLYFKIPTSSWNEKAPISVVLANSMPKTTQSKLPQIIEDNLGRFNVDSLDTRIKELVAQKADEQVIAQRRESARLELMGPRLN